MFLLDGCMLLFFSDCVGGVGGYDFYSVVMIGGVVQLVWLLVGDFNIVVQEFDVIFLGDG